MLLGDVDVARVGDLLGDKAFDTDAVRALLAELGITDTIPWKSNRKNPAPYDKNRYKGRHLVENVFGDFKEFRGLATRYCKYAYTFCAAFHLVTWCRRTGNGKLRSSPYLER